MKKHLMIAFLLSTHATNAVANDDTITLTHCVVNAPNGINIRLSPNPLNNGNIVGSLKNGDAIQQFGDVIGWSNIAISDEKPLDNVYIASRFLRSIGDDLTCS